MPRCGARLALAVLLASACAGRQHEPLAPFSGATVGIVEYRKVDLQGIDLRLTRGYRCHGPLPQVGGGAVMASADGERAGCSMAPYRGPLTLTAVDPRGRRFTLEHVPQADRDGQIRIAFAAVDAELRGRGRARGLFDVTRVELGRGGWAGIVDVAVLQSFRAEWHFRWIARGRGTPGLYLELHPTQPHGEQAQVFAAELEAAREQGDLERVEAGTLSPSAFLLRHPDSPLRETVAARVQRTAQPGRTIGGESGGAGSLP